MDIAQILFLIVGAVTLVSALLVVTQRNMVHSALWLILALFAVAVLFVLLDAGFMAVVQVVLYIGAIAILIIFAIMLTRNAMRDDVEQTNSQWLVSLLVASASFVVLAGLVVAHVWPTLKAMDFSGSVQQLGLALVDPNGFVLPFEVASILLLVALVGAIAVASEKK